MDKRLTRTALTLKNAERINKNRHAKDISGNRDLSWAYSQTHSTLLAVRTSRNGRGQELEAKRRLVYNFDWKATSTPEIKRMLSVRSPDLSPIQRAVNQYDDVQHNLVAQHERQDCVEVQAVNQCDEVQHNLVAQHERQDCVEVQAVNQCDEVQHNLVAQHERQDCVEVQAVNQCDEVQHNLVAQHEDQDSVEVQAVNQCDDVQNNLVAQHERQDSVEVQDVNQLVECPIPLIYRPHPSYPEGEQDQDLTMLLCESSLVLSNDVSTSTCSSAFKLPNLSRYSLSYQYVSSYVPEFASSPPAPDQLHLHQLNVAMPQPLQSDDPSSFFPEFASSPPAPDQFHLHQLNVAMPQPLQSDDPSSF